MVWYNSSRFFGDLEEISKLSQTASKLEAVSSKGVNVEQQLKGSQREKEATLP